MKSQGWQGEKQRHAMSARGISTATQEYKEFQKGQDAKRLQLETKLEKELEQMLGGDYTVEIRISPPDKVNISLYSDVRDLVFKSQVSFPSITDFAGHHDDDDYRDLVMETRLTLAENYFNNRVPEGPKRDAAKNSILEKYDTIEQWMEDVFPRDYDSLITQAYVIVERDFVPGDELSDKYRDEISELATQDLKEKGYGMVDVHALHWSIEEYQIMEIRDSTTLNSLEEWTKKIKRMINREEVSPERLKELKKGG